MIVFRRVMAVMLVFVFIVMYVPILVLFRVNDTVGNPDFYVDQLRRADAYNFAYDKALPAALDEAKLGNGSDGSIDLSRYKSDILSVLQQALPREYLQAQVEQAIETVLPYILGDEDSFNLTIPLKDRVVAAAAAAKAELHKPDVFNTLYDQVIARVVSNLTADTGAAPFSLSKADLEGALRSALPPDWVASQIDDVIDQLVPYLTNDKNSFAIKIDLKGRMDALQPVVTATLRKATNYDSLISNISDTALGRSWQNGYKLPIGLQLTSADLKPVITQVLPLSWYQGIVPQIVKPLFDYLKGAANSLQVVMPLTDRKPLLTTAVSQLADQKLRSDYDSLPVGTAQQLQQFLTNPPIGTLPTFRPPSLTYDQIKQLLKIDIGAQIAPFVTSGIPDQWVLTDSDLSSTFGAGASNLLGSIRDSIANGYVFTEVDLRNLLGQKNAQAIDNVRQDIAAGLVFTDQDLRSFIGRSGQDSLRTFDRVRGDLGTARKWKMLLWLMPGLVLVGIGFLGGRRWGSRFAWAAAVLVVTAAIVIVAVGPVFDAAAQPKISEQLNKANQEGTSLQALMSAKGASMAQNAIDTFIGGLQRQAVILLISSMLLLLIGIVWYLEDIRQGRHT